MTLEQMFDTRYKEILSNETFNEIPDSTWYELALASLKFNSPIGMGITGQEFKDLKNAITSRKLLSCWEFAILNNNLEARSPNDLKIALEPYCNIMVEIGNYSTTWQNQTGILREQLLDTIQEEQKKSYQSN